MLDSIRFSRLRLRSKLLLLAVLPILALMGTSGLLVRNAMTQRTVALNEQVEITRVGLASDLSSAMVLEREQTLRSTTNDFRLQQARNTADAAIAAYADAVQSDPVLSADIALLVDEVSEVRAALPDLATIERSRVTARLLPESEEGQTFALLDIIVNHAVDLTSVRPGTVTTEETAVLARSVKALSEYNAALRSELRAYVTISEAENLTVADQARRNAFRFSGRLDQLEAELLNSGDQTIATGMAEVVDSSTYFLLDSVRTRIATSFLDPEIAPSSGLFLAIEPLFRNIDALADQQVARVQNDASATAASAVRALTISAAGTLFFVLAVTLLMTALLRSIRAPLLTLTDQSREIARSRLPGVVAQIRELGGDAKVEMPEPLLAEADDEVGELVDAFNQLHTTAIELAAEQAASRRTVSEMFVNLGRRNQKILMRLLASLEKLERNERDPEVLQELFRIDHLATRMRRNAESLLVLAGAKNSRSFGSAVAIGDVVRAALSEVEDYERVTVVDEASSVLNGKAVADVGHLLAELIENALMFSPPDSPVEVRVVNGPEGLIISVGDRGIGLTTEELERNNQRIRDAASMTETPSRFLGLYVVGRLAHRHGLTVDLLSGVPNGLIARVKFPASLYEIIGGVEAPPSDDVVVTHEPTPEVAPANHQPPAVAPPTAAAPQQQSSAPAFSDPGPAGFIPNQAPQVAQTPQAPQPQQAPPAEFAPMAPAHRTPEPVAEKPQAPAAAPATPAAGFELPKRQKAAPLPSVEQVVRETPPSAAPRVDSNRNLAGFQRSVQSVPPQTPAQAGPPAAAEPAPTDRRRPTTAVPTTPVPPAAATPAPTALPARPVPQAAPADPGVFTAAKRVPGSSGLARKVQHAAPETAPVAPAHAVDTGAPAAAQIHANLSGFQRGVQRADTAMNPIPPESNPAEKGDHQ